MSDLDVKLFFEQLWNERWIISGPGEIIQYELRKNLHRVPKRENCPGCGSPPLKGEVCPYCGRLR